MFKLFVAGLVLGAFAEYLIGSPSDAAPISGNRLLDRGLSYGVIAILAREVEKRTGL